VNKAIITLELDKILEQLAGYASFSAGAELARALRPAAQPDVAQRWIAETSESRLLLTVKPGASIGGARDVRQMAARATRGVTLLPQDLLQVRQTLVAAARLKKTILGGDHEFPLLAQMARGLTECPALTQAIDRALDDQGAVLDGASPKLARLRREMRLVRDRIHEKLQRLLGSNSAQYLQEPIVSQRGGRWVVPLQSSFKGRIRGVVHDQSSSGATLWLEPLNTVDLNNDYRQALLREEEEVQRILAELSAHVADEADSIRWTVESLALLDLAFAKAGYAEATGAVAPELVPFGPGDAGSQRGAATGIGAGSRDEITVSTHPGSTLRLIQARHPLIDPATVVPIDVELDDETYIVVITGPNTGGKTVSLKTVGLLALMAQSGLHLPCDRAVLSVFETIFADIGDEQSIEQSLSTFSGHMTNVVEILGRADGRSLVVLDELGAGTDPTEGSALARAILTVLRDRGVTTFVATHYPELKLYGHGTPGVTNASVEFDLDTLAPTFRLRIGLAGRSNAFAIAARLGLDQATIDEARALISDSRDRADDLLDSIHKAMDEAEAEATAATRSRTEADDLRDELRQRLRQIDLERLRVLQDARIQAEAETRDFREELRRLRRELSAAGKPLTEIRRLRQEVERVEADAMPEPEPLPVVGGIEDERSGRPLQIGDTVWVKSLAVEGTVLSLGGAQAEVQIGRLRTRASLEELEWRPSAPAPPARDLPRSMARQAVTAKLELDMRGERVEGALGRLDGFLDSALLSNVPWVRIIHGKGTGRLRSAVREALKSHPHVQRIEDGKDGEGGWGVTVAHLVSD
jgi:DNA mismatch repair protein MutS2